MGQENPQRSLAPRGVAVVLIHGIGDIPPGDVLHSATTAIQEHLGIFATSPPQSLALAARPGETSPASVRRVALQFQGRSVDLVEFNWTSVTGKLRLTRPVDAIRKLLGVLRDLPALGTIGLASPADRAVLAVVGWFCQAAVLAILVTVAATLGHEILRYGEYAKTVTLLNRQATQEKTASAGQAADQGLQEGMAIVNEFFRQDSAFPRIAVAVLKGTVITLSVLVWLPVLHAVLRVVRGFHLRRSALLLLASIMGWAVTLIACWSLVMAGLFVFQLVLGLLEPATALMLRIATSMMFVVLLFWLPAKVAVTIVNLMRDMAHYLAPDRAGNLQPHQRAIQTELWRLITRLHAEGRYARMVLVAHSLGTVIVTDLLLGATRADPEAPLMTLDLVTAGSPLRRLIHRFFPDRTPDLARVRGRLIEAPGFRVTRWFNAYRLFDYVGQALTRSRFFLDLVGRRWDRGNPQSGIRERLLAPRFRWPVMHANYWGDARFLRFISFEVLRPILEDSAGGTGSHEESHPRAGGPAGFDRR